MLANPGLSKAEPLWGSSILQTSFAPILPFEEMKLKKRNTYGVVFHATYKPRVACTIVWQPWAIKNRTPMGFVNSANILCVVFPIERDEIKKAQHLWRCTPCYILTQGSSLRSPTLGYQKQNPDGVRLSHELSLHPLFLLKWLSKAEGDGVRQFCKHPLCLLFLLKWLSKAEGDGIRLLH